MAYKTRAGINFGRPCLFYSSEFQSRDGTEDEDQVVSFSVIGTEASVRLYCRERTRGSCRDDARKNRDDHAEKIRSEQPTRGIAVGE